MTTELWMLLWTALWGLVLPFAYTLPRVFSGGLSWGVGNREDVPETDPWVARAERAHRNLVEQLGPFAIIVLVIHLSGSGNELTAVGSIAFLACRVLHSLTYIAGIVWVRSVVFYTGWAIELVMALQVLLNHRP